MPIPVIDLFAGPGGLAEGFAAAVDEDGQPSFDVCLSVEKDEHAHRTLELRSFVRAFRGKAPDAYRDYLQGSITRETLFSMPKFCSEAERAKVEACLMTLGPDSRQEISRKVRALVKERDDWVLIGGPPCQAYSIIGRSRMRSADPAKFERDERHFLYREYLRIIAHHAPAVFVMENVKGLLSSKIGESSMIERILEDLSRPGGGALRYRLVPLTTTSPSLLGTEIPDFLVRSENFGIPQSRHRLIICGVREDIQGSPRPIEDCGQVSVRDAISDLPAIRSRLSQQIDSPEVWHAALAQATKLLKGERNQEFEDVAIEMFLAAGQATTISSSGKPFTETRVHASSRKNVQAYRSWISRGAIGGVTGHETRSHMQADLYRYLFASSFSVARSESPRLRDFPDVLLPKHKSAGEKKGTFAFADRFRVQLWDRPATTITSHICKDGHYFIHPDAAQCRSLSPREAARLQTFPDNYHFEGNRTQRFHQIGNAVPPLLAYKIARKIAEFLRTMRRELEDLKQIAPTPGDERPRKLA